MFVFIIIFYPDSVPSEGRFSYFNADILVFRKVVVTTCLENEYPEFLGI